MKCPICGKLVAMDDPQMPFCSERCRLIDLGKWSSEEYVISEPVPQTPAQSDEEDGE